MNTPSTRPHRGFTLIELPVVIPIIHGMPVLAWSTGKDGDDASTGAGDPKNRDNSYSW